MIREKENISISSQSIPGRWLECIARVANNIPGRGFIVVS